MCAPAPINPARIQTAPEPKLVNANAKQPTVQPRAEGQARSMKGGLRKPQPKDYHKGSKVDSVADQPTRLSLETRTLNDCPSEFTKTPTCGSQFKTTGKRAVEDSKPQMKSQLNGEKAASSHKANRGNGVIRKSAPPQNSRSTCKTVPVSNKRTRQPEAKQGAKEQTGGSATRMMG
ncbi:hypothetical protein AAF712_005651 [Marasmius tenuissimus]|uniref:Uncharacterized protein n=1 Tax=Marasmius tenuissimus TaxID=585030 RepID=A0ABR3A0Z5_9AGAR